MRVLLDMDGVLADFDAQLFEELEGTIVWPAEALRREARFCTDFLPRRERLIVREHIETTAFFSRLPVVEGAVEGVRDLYEAGHDLWVCSKPLEANPWCASDKMGWIEEHFPDLVGKVILSPNKSMIKGDVLLDDAHKPSGFGVADWVPVWYPYPHNRAEGRVYFRWGDGAAAFDEAQRSAEWMRAKELTSA